MGENIDRYFYNSRLYFFIGSHIAKDIVPSGISQTSGLYVPRIYIWLYDRFVAGHAKQSRFARITFLEKSERD